MSVGRWGDGALRRRGLRTHPQSTIKQSFLPLRVLSLLLLLRLPVLPLALTLPVALRSFNRRLPHMLGLGLSLLTGCPPAGSFAGRTRGRLGNPLAWLPALCCRRKDARERKEEMGKRDR